MSLYIDVKEARKTFHYCEKAGALKWRKDSGVWGRIKKGSNAGYVHTCGTKNTKKKYVRVFFNGSYIYAHRIIWAIKTGKQPKSIDHIDGDGLNNRWSNLRSVHHSVNGKNQKLHSTNTSGYSGVTYRKDSGRWRSRIMVDDKMISLGTFSRKEDAIQARKLAEKKYGYI